MMNEHIDPALRKAIRERWPTAADFYAERDDRTLRETPGLAAYARRRVEILVDPAAARSSSTQRIALVASNLTSRWARNIRIVMPGGTPIAEGLGRGRFTQLAERLLSEMYGADPFGDFGVIDTRSYDAGGQGPLRLFVGDWSTNPPDNVRIGGDDFLATAAGEYATGRRGEAALTDATEVPFPPSPALAAAIGVADLFKRAVGQPREHWVLPFDWNLVDHSLRKSPAGTRSTGPARPWNVGNILIAGIGAIGSSLGYLLDLSGMEGDVALLDRDRVETSNLNRSLVFDVSHVLDRARKTDIVAEFLQSDRVQVSRLDGTWRELAPAVSAAKYDVWVSFTNEDAAWAQLPFQLPPVVLQGTTTSGWGFGAGRHIPRKEDCTLCRMPRPAAEFRGPCADGEVEQTKSLPPVRAALPFLSAASAALVLAELLKLQLPDIASLPNDVAADLKTGLPAVVALNRSIGRGCRGCGIMKSDIWYQRGGRGRYAFLST